MDTNNVNNLIVPSVSPAVSYQQFIDLPDLVHSRLAVFLGAKDLLNVSKTCRVCKEIYDVSSNWRPFLKRQYQQSIPNLLTKEMFNLNTRKTCNITFIHTEDFLKKIDLKFLLDENFVNNEDVQFLSQDKLRHLSCIFHNKIIIDLIKNGFLSIEESKSIDPELLEKLSDVYIERSYFKKRLSFHTIKNMTKTQFERLQEENIYRLFRKNALSLDVIKSLTERQFLRLSIDEISIFFINNILTLEDLEKLKDEQVERISKEILFHKFLFDGLSTREELFAILSNKTRAPYPIR